LSKYNLPGRVPSYLRRLDVQYASTAPPYQEIVSNSRIRVIEEAVYNGIDGDQSGHNIILYVPVEILGKTDVDMQLGRGLHRGGSAETYQGDRP
jgi:hypothetical protein